MEKEIERFEIEKYFLEILPDHLTSNECLSLFCLVADERPGSLAMGISQDTENILQQFASKFGIHTKTLGERNNILNPGVFMAQNEERLSRLEKSSGKFYTCSDRDVGWFLGYPKAAIDFYDRSSENRQAPSQIYLRQLEKLYRDDILSKNDIKHLELIDYVPRPAEKNIKNAISRGREKKREVRAFDEREGINAGELYIQEIFHHFDLDEILSRL